MKKLGGFSYLYEFADGDMGFVTEILGLMESNIPADVTSIEKAIALNDLVQVQKSAHHMQSSIQYSNNNELTDLLAAIEDKKKSATAITELNAIMPVLKKLSDQLMAAIMAEKKKIG